MREQPVQPEGLVSGETVRTLIAKDVRPGTGTSVTRTTTAVTTRHWHGRVSWVDNVVPLSGPLGQSPQTRPLGGLERRNVPRPGSRLSCDDVSQ
jgi:hypothetical protein